MLSTVFFARPRSRKGYNYWDYFRMEIYSKMKEVKGKVFKVSGYHRWSWRNQVRLVYGRPLLFGFVKRPTLLKAQACRICV